MTDSLMELNEDERQWALEIKDAVELDEDLENLTDLQYAQYAVITNGDIDNAIHRIHGMQLFRNEFGISQGVSTLEQVEEGIRYLICFLKQQKWHILNIEKDNLKGNHVLVVDFASFNPKAAKKTPAAWRDFLRGIFYLQECLAPNLTAIRVGIARICECSDMSWNNIDIDFFHDLYSHFIEFYPCRNEVVSFYHSSVICNIAHSIIKTAFGDNAKNVQMGVRFEDLDSRLDVLFKTPNEQVAEQRLFNKMHEFLTERYINMRDFSLETDSSSDYSSGSEETPSLSDDERVDAAA